MNLLEGEREEILNSVDDILASSEINRRNLIPILQSVQERLGYLPGPALEKVAEAMGMAAVDVYGVATFYNQFRFHPPGEHQIIVCMGTACYIVGGQIAMDSFARRLNISEGETTPDRKYGLERVACVGCCTMAPVVVVDEQMEGSVTPTRVDGILLSLEANGNGEKPGEEE
ncbi:NADH-quinone oxidoreductase subunit NuoE [Dethiobacter alkaliphilus]|uniref:NADH-quinone oxidoreductase subunit NuoE n=1 Tax=Dethiobacter alkaliphilus TaxID=427926 RepID=UPI002225CCEF|nr:NADH-quinone oxidoreductase subunit NuoE [Dethiobacter alkaliphilus]MCW3489245.1 NADH-quinone oxidoreductase subunit NuoE [Dethiobacter alkaliphilus]